MSYGAVDHLPKFNQLPLFLFDLLLQRAVLPYPFPYIGHHHTDVTAVDSQGVPLFKLLSLDQDSLQLVIQVDIEAIKFVAVFDKGDSSTAELIDLQLILSQFPDLVLILDSLIARLHCPEILLQNVVPPLEELISSLVPLPVDICRHFICLEFCFFRRLVPVKSMFLDTTQILGKLGHSLLRDLPDGIFAQNCLVVKCEQEFASLRVLRVETEEDGVRTLGPAKEIRLRIKLNELDVEHQSALAITLKLLQTLPGIVEGHEEVLVRFDLLDQDTFVILFVLCGLLLLIGIHFFEGIISSHQAPNAIRRVVVEQKAARASNVGN